ncbi:hypothetical protein [Pedobacter glucosidilyticus]|uniref:hypothetical protein n=1 Tax=Pedobacter glucosidilyticus TaxID=1122941 RepID=UPI0003F87AF1|nr:hypothetical protein [Pedobacter glucosidilyticus]
MKSIKLQKQLNAEYAKRNPNMPKVLDLYVRMNEEKVKEGLPYLRLENLEKRIALRSSII